MNRARLPAERMDRSHLAGAAELERLCFAEPWSEKSLELLLSDAAVGFAVRGNEGQTVIGYGGMMLAPGEGQITNIAVHPGHRRQGAGQAILCALLREAERLELEQVSLEVRASNVPAIAMYEANGFQTVGRRAHFYRRPAEDALVMVKRLQ